MKSIFIGKDGWRAGWRFLAFVVLAQLVAKAMFWTIGRFGDSETEGWTAMGFIVEGAISSIAALVTTVVMARGSAARSETLAWHPVEASPSSWKASAGDSRAPS